MATTFGTGSTTGTNAKLAAGAPNTTPHNLWVCFTAGGTLWPRGSGSGTEITCPANVPVRVGLIGNLRSTEYQQATGTCAYWADPA